jgi:hypothetical protein
MMTGKVRSILDMTSGDVGVLDGWGGVYILELMEAGAHGVMSGLGVADLLARVFSLMRSGLKKDALRVFQGVLPAIVYSLQNLEFFHHAEKKLLEARGVMRHTTVRELTMTIDPLEVAHIHFLNRSVLELLDSWACRIIRPGRPVTLRWSYRYAEYWVPFVILPIVQDCAELCSSVEQK